MSTCSQAREKFSCVHRLQKSERRNYDRHLSYHKNGQQSEKSQVCNEIPPSCWCASQAWRVKSHHKYGNQAPMTEWADEDNSHQLWRQKRATPCVSQKYFLSQRLGDGHSYVKGYSCLSQLTQCKVFFPGQKRGVSLRILTPTLNLVSAGGKKTPTAMEKEQKHKY